MKTRPICCAVAATAAALAAEAQIANTGVMTEQTNSFLPDDGDPDEFRSTASVSAAAPLGSFTHAFSALGDTEWTVTWAAPEGKHIEIVIPVGSTGFGLQFEFGGGTGSTSDGRFRELVTPVLDLAPGSAPFPSLENAVNFTLSGVGGDRTAAVLELDDEGGALFTPGEIYRFTSLSATTTVPADYDLDWDNAIEFFNIRGSVSFDAADSPTDPGQWIRIVPAPGAAGLLALGALAATRRRRGPFGRSAQLASALRWHRTEVTGSDPAAPIP